jgi:hypothetical protein
VPKVGTRRGEKLPAGESAQLAALLKQLKGRVGTGAKEGARAGKNSQEKKRGATTVRGKKKKKNVAAEKAPRVQRVSSDQGRGKAKRERGGATRGSRGDGGAGGELFGGYFERLSEKP